MLQYNPLLTYYNCNNCNDNQKKTRGCKRKIKDSPLHIDCTCEANIIKCNICSRPLKGKREKVSWGWFTIDRCPVSFAKDRNIDRILPYFWHWRGTNNMQFPDNQGRYEQPSMLLEAFSICSHVANKRERTEAENARNLNSK